MSRSRLSGGVHRALVTVGAVGGAVLLGAGVAGATDPVQLRSHLGDWCLDAPDGPGMATVVNPCAESPSQHWVFRSAGQIANHEFPDQCLTLSGGDDGVPATLASCRDTDDHQRWTPQADGQLISELGPCLNIFGGVAAPGTAVIGYHCIPGVTDEQWVRVL